jgi:predicted Fe-Mo cluster-binding NifX family protein
MRIAVSSSGPGLDAEVDPRFGRCKYFVLVDAETMESETIENPNVMASGGAGIQAAQLAAEKGVQVVLTGHCGPNAFKTLKTAGIPICLGAAGTVCEAVELYKNGDLSPAEGPDAAGKSGSGPGTAGPGAQGGRGLTGPGFQQGGGMGHGMGLGMGWGFGRGMGGGGGHRMRRWSRWHGDGGGRVPGTGPPGWAAGPVSGLGSMDELGMLKEQAEHLEAYLGEIRQRIQELEKGDKA